MTTLARDTLSRWSLPVVGFAAVAALFAGSAQAAPVIVGGHYEETNGAVCDSNAACTTDFTFLANGKHLLIQDVSCRIEASSTAQISDLNLSQAGSRATRLEPTLVASVPAKRVWLVNDPVSKIVLHHSTPRVKVTFTSTQNTINMQCTITGKLLPLN